MKALLSRLWALPALLIAALVQAAPTVTYYYNDLAGSPLVATNGTGQEIWRESYQPYGARTLNDPDAAANKVWFTSRRQDAETGLVYMGARYYDPVVGRFVSTDPAGFDETNLHGFNRYAYANNNPYRYVDPDGRWAIPLIPAALEAAAPYLIGAAAAWGIYNSTRQGKEGKGELNPSPPSAAAAGGAPDPDDGGGKERYSGRYSDGDKAYRTNVPRDAKGRPEALPEAEGPHSRLQPDARNPGRTYSATEFDAQGNPIQRTDFAGRKGEPIPHRHPWDPARNTFSKQKVPIE